MCVLKHSTWAWAHLSPLMKDRECFNTLWFFIPQKELHPTGRPFVHVLSADQDLVSHSHCSSYATKNCFLIATLKILARSIFWLINCLTWSVVKTWVLTFCVSCMYCITLSIYCQILSVVLKQPYSYLSIYYTINLILCQLNFSIKKPQRLFSFSGDLISCCSY